MQVTSALLADAATMAEGKLYVHGGGWNSIISPQIPTVHPSLALVLAFKAEWHEANENLAVAIELVNEDGQPAGVRVDMTMRVAPSPIAKKGADLYQSTAHTFIGLRFEKYGAYRFQVTHNEQMLATVPIVIMPHL
jgi:hypothetical protein